MPPPTIDTEPCEAAATATTLSVWPGSGSVSFDSTVIVLAPPSSRTVTVSSAACGLQSTIRSTVASLLCIEPSYALYLKLACPQKPAAGVNVKPPDEDRSTVPPTSLPGVNTAVRLDRPKSLPSTPGAVTTIG